MKKTAGKKKAPNKGYTAADMRAVSHNPEWTKEDFAKARPFDEMFPGLRKGRGPAKKPTKKSVTIRLDQNVVAFFKKDGDGWQGRINQTLADAVEKASRKRRGSAR
jgi:uncharacterized protein (DUF4415 family)